MMKFTNLEEFNKFCDESMFCICGELMTGLHMSGCQRLRRIRNKLVEQEKFPTRGKADHQNNLCL